MTTALTPKRRFDRASWLTVAVVLVFAAACAVVTAIALSQPGDGCLLDATGTGRVIACVGDWDTTLRVDDRILAVAGVALNGEGALRWGVDDRLAGRAGDAALPYTLERAGEQREVTVPLGRLDAAGVLRAFGAGLAHYGNGWLLWLCLGAVVIFALAPRVRAAQLLLVATGCGVAATTLAWTAESVGTTHFAPAPVYVTLVICNTFWGWLLMPTLLLLVLSFPRRVWPLARWPSVVPTLLYGLPLVTLAATLLAQQPEPYLILLGVSALAFLVATVAVTAHTILRVRDPVVRAQTGWLSLGLLVGIGVWPLLFSIGVFYPPAAEGSPPGWAEVTLEVVTSTVFVLCLGIAITRYRLFDIDLIIRRTVVYGALTVTLAGVYLVSVALAQSLLRALTGQESDLAIVVATLAVAALFQPLRARIQAFIDRRFFRRRYNAAQVLAAHGAAMRDMVDISQVTAALTRVTDEVLRPAHVAIWLRAPEDPR